MPALPNLIPFKKAFGARLRDDDVEFLNENLDDLIPDGYDESTLTGRIFLMHLASRTLAKTITSKTSLQSDIDKIEALKTELETLNGLQQQNVRNAEEKQDEIERLQNEILGLKEDKKQLQSKLSHFDYAVDELNGMFSTVDEKARKLQNKVKDDPTFISHQLTPGQYAVASIIRQKLSALVKKDISIMDMIFDLFWRYNLDQKTQIAFPFFLTPKKIKEILKENDSDNG